MYEEFKRLALEDAQLGYRLVIVHLIINIIIIIIIMIINVSSIHYLPLYIFLGMVWSVCLGFIAMGWRSSSVLKFLKTLKERHLLTTTVDIFMVWKNIGLF